MNVLYDADGYEYPIDKHGQIYVPLESEQTVVEVEQRKAKMKQETKRILC